MIPRRRQLLIFAVLVLIALQQSCGTHSIPPQRMQATVTPAPVAPDAAPAPEGRIASLRREKTPPAPQSAEPESEPVSEPPFQWPPRETVPESIVGAPEKDAASSGTKYDTIVSVRTAGLAQAWQFRQNPQGKIVGFEFSNRGGNRILPQFYNIEKNLFFTRDFQFRFDDRARQDIHLWIVDWAPSRDRQFRLSELMNSVMLFFPRVFVPAISGAGMRSVVTLPTGEEVHFDARTHEIVGGVLSEGAVDLNPDKAARRFARVQYQGRGVVVRADARGADPRLGATATITATAAAGCEGTGCQSSCRVPARELWEQNGAARFKFSTDESFDRYLAARCGFVVPKFAPDSMVASSS